jgi:hypothetical protein
MLAQSHCDCSGLKVMVYTRMVFMRLHEQDARGKDAREIIYESCRQEVAELHEDAETLEAELNKLEKAIRRHEVQSLLEEGAASPGISRVEMDDIYEQVSFRQFRSGVMNEGVVGWRDGASPWVTLQVWDGPAVDCAATDLPSAYKRACRKLARKGYVPDIKAGQFALSAEELAKLRSKPGWRVWAAPLTLLALAAYFLLA